MNCFRYSRKKKSITVHDYIKIRKKSIYTNLVLLSINQWAIYLIQKMIMTSRMYEYDYPGFYGYIVFHAAKACFFPILPALILPRFKMKEALLYALTLYLIFIFMRYFDRIEIILVSALLMAPALVIMRLVQRIYITQLAKIMCKVTGRSIEITLVQMSGIFLSIYRTYQSFGDIPVLLVNSTTDYVTNMSKVNCGLDFHYGRNENVTELSIPPEDQTSQIMNLVIIILALFVLVLTSIFLKPLKKITTTELGAEPEPRSLLSTVKLIKTLQLRVIIPMTICSGYEKIFLRYDYLMAYIGCKQNRYQGMDQHFLGAIVSSQMTISTAALVSVVNMEILLLIAGILFLIPTLLLLANVEIETVGYYCISGIWSLASAMWDCLIYALYVLLFPKDELEAFAHLGLWHAFGVTMSFILTLFAGTLIKVWILLILLLLSITTIILLPFVKSALHNKIGAVEDDITFLHKESIKSDKDTDQEPNKSKMPSVSFRKSSVGKIDYSTEIKSFSTMKYHHIRILKEREDFVKDLTEEGNSRIDRIESSTSQTF